VCYLPPSLFHSPQTTTPCTALPQIPPSRPRQPYQISHIQGWHQGRKDGGLIRNFPWQQGEGDRVPIPSVIIDLGFRCYQHFLHTNHELIIIARYISAAFFVATSLLSALVGQSLTEDLSFPERLSGRRARRGLGSFGLCLFFTLTEYMVAV